MRTPFQMFGQAGSPAMSAVQQARQAVAQTGSPEAALRQLISSNPDFARQVGNRTPEQAVREIATRRGIDLNTLIGMMGGRR